MLGEYKLNEIYNEDSYKAIKKIPDKSIDLIVTDPPYEFGAVGSGILKDRKTSRFEEIRRLKIEKGIDEKILEEFIRIMKKINIYIWCNKKQIQQYFDFFKEKDCTFEIIIWNKTNPTPLINNSYLPDKEYCLFFRESGVKLEGVVETMRTVYTTKCNKDDKDLYNHPTIKPIDIIKNLIINSSNENDIVADFFLGSGTTCVASKELNRRYIGFEIDKEYFDIAKNRLNGINANGQMSIFTDTSQLELEVD